MNTLYNLSEFLFTILYAHDICVLMNGKQLDDLITRMKKKLVTWLQSNKLSLNGQKTYYIHGARIKLTSHIYNLYMGGSIYNIFISYIII